MNGRATIFVVMAVLVFGIAACDTKTAPTTPKSSKKPVASPTPAPTPSTTPSPTPNPTPTSASAKPSPSPSPSPSEEPGLEGSPPPLKFPYTAVGQNWNYVLSGKSGPFPLNGNLALEVTDVKETTASVTSKISVTLPTSPVAKTSESKAAIKNSVENPFSLAALLDSKASGTATPAIETTSTVRKWGRGEIKVEAGTFTGVVYYIEQKTGADQAHIVLWVDEKNGTMYKEQINSDKLPNLGEGFKELSAVNLGKTSMTLSLKAFGSPSPVLSASPSTKPASADPGTSPTASTSPATGASGAASPSPPAAP